MSGIFSTLNTATKGLMAQQTALATTSHNISNANTEGFSRQRVDLKADLAFNYTSVGQIGTGVKIESVVRMVDAYVNKQIMQENGTLKRFTAKSEVMEQLEIIYNEPSDTGLNFNLDEMFNAWQELSKNPESLNSKTIVAEKSKTLADTMNHMANQLSSLKAETIELINKSVADFNSIVSQIDSLNQQIFNISVKGQVPNDLLDQRDLMLKNLSSITNFDASYDKFGRVSIYIGTTEVLSDNIRIELAYDDFIPNASVTSGEIKGFSEALEELDEQIVNFDAFAKALAEAVNEIHNDGSDGSIDFFTFGIAGNDETAANFQVNQEILENEALVRTGVDNNSPVGDGSRALEMARLRNKQVIGGTTLEGAYRDLVIKVGISKEHADNMAANQRVLLDQLELRRESVSGVSIDEEVTNLVKFQRAYEANAKAISVLAEMLDTLINRTGV